MLTASLGIYEKKRKGEKVKQEETYKSEISI
jgi:hypothetical protein